MTYKGSNYFRQRLILSTLSGKSVRIRDQEIQERRFWFKKNSLNMSAKINLFRAHNTLSTVCHVCIIYSIIILPLCICCGVLACLELHACGAHPGKKLRLYDFFFGKILVFAHIPPSSPKQAWELHSGNAGFRVGYMKYVANVYFGKFAVSTNIP